MAAVRLVLAHPDLELQIRALSARIEAAPGDADGYLQRGEAYRRHRNWPLAALDFARVRELEPDHPLIDFLDGRLRAEAGSWREGERLLSRFLAEHPYHAGAYRARAGAVWSLGEPLSSARDYARAIEFSESPAPSLYRSMVVAQWASGEAFHGAALVTVDNGLQRFAGEVSLLGLGVDIALAKSDTQRAASYLATLPQPLMLLPQWRFRRGLLFCLSGDPAAAADAFAALQGDPAGHGARRHGTWRAPGGVFPGLATGEYPEACRRAALAALGALQP